MNVICTGGGEPCQPFCCHGRLAALQVVLHLCDSDVLFYSDVLIRTVCFLSVCFTSPPMHVSSAAPRTAVLIKRLRAEVSKVFALKIEHPSLALAELTSSNAQQGTDLNPQEGCC